jgi:hypothetical protein
VFGWLQITGVILGGIVTLLGIALALEWVPYPRRGGRTTAATGSQSTTVVTEPRDRTR